MLRSFLVFLVLGIVWLFIFSIPVGHNGKRVFNIGYYYIVNTRLVHLVTDLISTTAHKTEDTATDIVDDVVSKVEQGHSK